MQNGTQRRVSTDRLIQRLLLGCVAGFAGVLCLILWTILSRGLPALSWEIISQAPKGGFYLGKGGGVLNAIIGSVLLATGGTVLALLVSLPVVMTLHLASRRGDRFSTFLRVVLDTLWGIPSIVYGAFGFTVLLALGARASLLAGMLVLMLVEFPIMTRAMDEVMRRIPRELEDAAVALGATPYEVTTGIALRQALPGLLTAVLLAYGRGIGDAAAVLYTAGFTDRITTALSRPTASLPLAVFFQLSSPVAAVRARGYAAAVILTVIVLTVSTLSRLLTRRFLRYTIQ